LQNAHQKLGWLHGLYGLGALTSPLVATAFVTSNLRFQYFYTVSLGLGLTNVVGMLASFRLEREKEATEIMELHCAAPPAPLSTRQESKEMQILKMNLTWIFCFFLLLYVGESVDPHECFDS